VPSWSSVEAATPELAAEVRERFERHGLAIMATIRAGGAPRVSGIEPLFGLGELWMGMMEGSLKVADPASRPQGGAALRHHGQGGGRRRRQDRRGRSDRV